MTLKRGELRTATKDHIVPTTYIKKMRKTFGNDAIRIPDKYNTVAACTLCNSMKSDHPVTHVVGNLMKIGEDALPDSIKPLV